MTKTLGVTGGIGSGKTTVCRMLEALGARVFYADEEARTLMETNPDVRRELTDAFGPESYRADGTLDRAHLARVVFGNEANVARINAIVHPRVHAAFAEAKKKAGREGIPLLVKEAALIFESGGEKMLDAVAVVHAPEAERVRRVTRRDAVQPEQVRARMHHQLPPDDLRRRADFILENTGSLADLQAQVEKLYAWATERDDGRRTADDGENAPAPSP